MIRMAAVINGQLSLYDYLTDQENLRPCDYSFKRYIGQKVGIGYAGYPTKIGVITDIEPYYTIVDAGDRYMIGTPTNMWPIEGGDLNENKKDG